LSSIGDTRIFAGSDTLVATGSAVFNVKATGAVTASAGLIGGWTVVDGTINRVTSTKYSGLSSVGTTRFFAGADNLAAGTGSAPFNVKADGVVTASAGLIGGWTVKSNKLFSANTRVTMSAAPGAEYFAVRNENLVEKVRIGEISVAASDKYGIKVFDDSGVADNDDGEGQVVLLGELGNKIGGWEITSTQIRSIPNAGLGGAYAEAETGLILHDSGSIETSDFATGLKGWRISSLGNGTAEFENARIRGILWISTAYGQDMRLGRNVSGTNDGIYINTHNYWYTDGAFKLGTATKHIRFDGSSALNVNFDDILINTSTFQVSSSLNSGTLRLGSSVTAITSTTNTGVYMDGTGKFRVGESTNGDNFIYFDGTTTQIKSTNFDITGTNLKLESSTERAGEMWLGTIQAANDSSGVGFYASSSGVVRIFADSDNYITFGDSTLNIKTETLNVDTSTFDLNTTAGGTIAMGSTPPSI
jgi:hypothetical protein